MVGRTIRRPSAHVLSRPAELCAIAPHAMHDHRHPARQCDDGLLSAAPPSDIHGPRPQPRPFRHARQQRLRGFVKQRSHHAVAAAGYPADAATFARLMEHWRQHQDRSDRLGVAEAGRNVDGRRIGQRRHPSDARYRRQPPADRIIADDGKQLAVKRGKRLAQLAARLEQRFDDFGQIATVTVTSLLDCRFCEHFGTRYSL